MLLQHLIEHPARCARFYWITVSGAHYLNFISNCITMSNKLVCRLKAAKQAPKHLD